MKKIKLLLVAGACVVLSACSPQAPTVHTTDKGTQWEWNEGTIVVKSPERPAGQKSVIGLTAPKMEVVRVGFVGLGMRGPGAVSRFTHIPGTQIVALCDYDPKRAEACQNILKKASMPKAAIYSGETGYEELCKRDDIDLVYIRRLVAPLPHCQMCIGERQARSHRGTFCHEPAGMLGSCQLERDNTQALLHSGKLLL